MLDTGRWRGVSRSVPLGMDVAEPGDAAGHAGP